MDILAAVHTKILLFWKSNNGLLKLDEIDVRKLDKMEQFWRQSKVKDYFARWRYLITAITRHIVSSNSRALSVS